MPVWTFCLHPWAQYERAVVQTWQWLVMTWTSQCALLLFVYCSWGIIICTWIAWGVMWGVTIITWCVPYCFIVGNFKLIINLKGGFTQKLYFILKSGAEIKNKNLTLNSSFWRVWFWKYGVLIIFVTSLGKIKRNAN